MNNIIKENKLLLNKIKELNKNIKIEIQIESLKQIKDSINKFDDQFNQMSEILNICSIIKNKNKELFNVSVNKLKDKIIYNNYDEKNDNYVDYKSIIEEIDQKKHKEIINIPVIFVEDENDIKNSPIYYINNKKQFGIKINNNLLVGNIGNIYNKNDKQKVKTKKCNKLFCNKNDCFYYHDNRNFMNYSWIHSTSYKIPKTKKINGSYQITTSDKYNTRILGSRNTILEDLLYVDIHNEKELRNSQLMHDILIYQILGNYSKLCINPNKIQEKDV